MVGLVEKMLDLHKRLHKAKSQADKEALDRQIAVADAPARRRRSRQPSSPARC